MGRNGLELGEAEPKRTVDDLEGLTEPPPADISRWSTLDRRTLMLELGDPARASAHGDATQRWTFALALGVKAASTAEEQVRHALVGEDGMLSEIERFTAVDWERLVERAHRRMVPATIAYVDDRLHVLNGGGARERVEPEDAEWMDVEPRPSAVTRLLHEAAPWTRLDWEEDPCLDGAVAQLATDDADREALKHARLGLFQAEAWDPMKGPAYSSSSATISSPASLSGSTFGPPETTRTRWRRLSAPRQSARPT